MNAKLYVGNLPFSVTEAELSAHFAKNGGRVAKAELIMDRETQRPRGFGFVEMLSEEEANEAIASLHGKDFGGRTLTVNLARPKENNNRPQHGGNGGGGGQRFNDRGRDDRRGGGSRPRRDEGRQDRHQRSEY
jgi:cold-inducible RNA-binding protein